MATWKKLSLLLSIIPLLLLLAYGFKTNPRDVPSPLVGRQAPPFALTMFDGSRNSLEQLRGKPVVLNFWASWCFPACYEEAPHLETAWQTYRDRGLMVIGVDIQDRDADAKAFIDRFKLSFPSGPDLQGKISIDYGVYGVPETFFIGKDGTIHYKHVGAVDEKVLKAKIEEML
ncbi:membrane protein [Candidatus Methylomirabilis lanthanidiphila]|uniref:Membrane protein n=1 Tax=Candidatus Methylomirabilis lanthanidiphila TaxID=2211376 RepID=A0A564ZLA6_9BACT|nr:TlpA family protein disulfide reductase [Candidatus Methylomirabilis lanthanidiphila]VUZ86105.1 membrane protein [Candidatus Methylomirabilis lanthanidiphila]